MSTTTDTLKRILATPAATLAEARRIIDAARGLLPGGKPAKPASDNRPVESRLDEIIAEKERSGSTFAEAIGKVVTGGIYAQAATKPSDPATPEQLARIKELEKAIAAQDGKLAGLRAREAALLQRKGAKGGGTAPARPAPASRPTATATPAPPLSATMKGESLETLKSIVNPRFVFSPAERSAAAAELTARGWATNAKGTIWVRSVDCAAAKAESAARRAKAAEQFARGRNR